MQISELNNPKQIEGILLWNRGNPIEIVSDDETGFQEYPKSIELWQKLEDGRLLRIERWLKKSITHYIINKEFQLKF